MSRAKALTTVGALKERIDSLSIDEKNRVLRLAYNYNANTIEFLQHMSMTLGTEFANLVANSDTNSYLAIKKLKNKAYDMLIKVFPHWTKDRVNEEVNYMLGHSTMYLDRMEWELKVIHKHYIENK